MSRRRRRDAGGRPAPTAHRRLRQPRDLPRRAAAPRGARGDGHERGRVEAAGASPTASGDRGRRSVLDWLASDVTDDGAAGPGVPARLAPRRPTTPAVAAYAAPSFPPGRPVVEARARPVAAHPRRLRLRPRRSPTCRRRSPRCSTHRRGVCQDFAHLAIGCLRSLGLPARYVSGYIETEPPPGKPKLVGADASHAWCSVYVPGWGWLDLDPTNDQVRPGRHVTVAWGRDYGDVAPLRGVVFGPATDQELDVAVDVAVRLRRRRSVRPPGRGGHPRRHRYARRDARRRMIRAAPGRRGRLVLAATVALVAPGPSPSRRAAPPRGGDGTAPGAGTAATPRLALRNAPTRRRARP